MATANVSTFLELKNALEDSTSTEIIVENDINFSSGGIKVNSTKGNITIDFGGYTITDNNTLVLTDGIYVPANSPEIVITAKNGRWNGRNYYGIIGVTDGNSQVTIVLDGISFTGPQLAYNKSGTIKIIDCDIVIDKNASTTSAQELCEGNRIIISGQVVVNSNSTTNSVIWFTNSNASLTVEEDSTFEVNALYTYFFYTDSSPILLFKKNSTTFINTKNGLFYGSGNTSHIASSFTLEENGTFSATQNESNSAPLFKCLNDFSLSENSSFSLYSIGQGKTPLMYFGGKATINIISPKSVVLYNNGGNVFSFQTGSTTSPNNLNITVEMLRLWDEATTPITNAGGFDDEPTSNYHKILFTDEFTANFELSSSQVLSVNSNLEEFDEGYPISTNIPLLSSQVISMGKLTLLLDGVTDISTEITGETMAYANVRARFDNLTLNDIAGSDGQFAIMLNQAVPIGTPLLIESNRDFLTKSYEIVIEGSLSITKLPQLDFWAFLSRPQMPTIYRVKTDWEIEITDTRTYGAEWFLYAYIEEPLTSSNNSLPGALRFQNAMSIPVSDTPMLIYSGKWQENQPITKISWEKTKGFLLNIDTNQVYSPGKYSTSLHWMITTYKLN